MTIRNRSSCNPPLSEQKSATRYEVCFNYTRLCAAWLRGGVSKRFPYVRDGLGIETGCRQFVICGGNEIRQAAILFEQSGPFYLADAAYLIEQRGHEGFAAQLAMEVDGKSMGLIANALHEMGGWGIRAEHNRIFSTGQKNPLVLFAACFGQSNNCQILMADLFQPFHSCSKLA